MSSPIGTEPSQRPDESHLFEIQAVPPPRVYIQRMWEKRDFVAALPIEQLKASHQATLLGNVWHLGNPVLSVVVYYVIFGLLLGVSRGMENFTLFLVIGVFAYRQTSACVTGGANSIASNAGLMRAIRFPRAVLPLSTVFSNLLTFGFELFIVGCVAVLTGEGLTRKLFLLPIVVLIQATLNLGGAFIAARLNDTFRDVQQIIPFVMRLGMYASGVMFPIRERVVEAPGWVQAFVEWNPMVAVLDLYRWVFMDWPITVSEVLRLAVVAVLLLVVGFRFFIAAESKYGRG